MAYRHIVLFRIHDGVDEQQLADAIDALRGFARFPGVESWVITMSLDERKGRILLEDASLVGREGFDAFRLDPAHVRAARLMSEIADWWIGDYEE